MLVLEAVPKMSPFQIFCVCWAMLWLGQGMQTVWLKVWMEHHHRRSHHHLGCASKVKIVLCERGMLRLMKNLQAWWLQQCGYASNSSS